MQKIRTYLHKKHSGDMWEVIPSIILAVEGEDVRLYGRMIDVNEVTYVFGEGHPFSNRPEKGFKETLYRNKCTTLKVKKGAARDDPYYFCVYVEGVKGPIKQRVQGSPGIECLSSLNDFDVPPGGGVRVDIESQDVPEQEQQEQEVTGVRPRMRVNRGLIDAER